MKRTKNQTKTLREIAKGLPPDTYYVNEVNTQSGADLIQRGITQDGEGGNIMPHKEYHQKVRIPIPANHENRLKSAFDANGYYGVKMYLTKYVKTELRDEFFGKLKALLSAGK